MLRIAASFLYGVSPTHPATIAHVILILTGVGILDPVRPAYTAVRIDAWDALRHE